MINLKKTGHVILCFLLSQSCGATTFTTTAGGETFTLDGDYFLTGSATTFGAYNNITFANATLDGLSVTLDGANKTLNYSSGSSTALFGKTGANTMTVTVQNVTISFLSPASLTALNSGLTVNFGDNVTILLADNLIISSSDRTWNFTGNAIINAEGKTIYCGEDKISLTGANKKLSIKNATIGQAGTRPIVVNTASATVVFDNVNFILGYGGLDFSTGNVEFINQVTVNGSWMIQPESSKPLITATLYDSPWYTSVFDYGIPSAGNSFMYWTLVSNAVPTLQPYVVYNVNLGGYFQYAMVRPSGGNNVSWAGGADSYIRSTAAGIHTTYDVANIGSDGAFWLIHADREVYREKLGSQTATSFVSSGLTVTFGTLFDGVAVGDQLNVIAWNRSTGAVYKCNNPTDTTPDNWSLVTGFATLAGGVTAKPRSMGIGSDGTIWYIADQNGAVYKKVGSINTLIHNGVGRNLQRISAFGTATTNFVSLLDTPGPRGRAWLSKDNSPFYLLAINSLYNFCIGSTGAGVATSRVNDTEYSSYEFNIAGLNPLIYAAAPALHINTSGKVTIKSGSTLKLTDGALLYYSADPSSDANNIAATKRHFIMEDSSATLHLISSTLTSTDTGMALDIGNFIIEGNCTINSSTSAKAEFELAANVSTLLKSNSKLTVTGPIING